MRNLYKHLALTLIEIFVVLTIIAIVTPFAINSATEIVATNNAKSLTSKLTSSIRLARTEALARGRIVRVCPTESYGSESTCLTGETNTKWNFWKIVIIDNSGKGYEEEDIKYYQGIDNAITTTQIPRHTFTGLNKIIYIEYSANGRMNSPEITLTVEVKNAPPSEIREIKVLQNGTITINEKR